MAMSNTIGMSTLPSLDSVELSTVTGGGLLETFKQDTTPGNGSAVGGFSGWLGGAFAGGAIGSVFGPAGTLVGAGVGSFAGIWAGNHYGHKLGWD
jgi:phage tail tape-measure protein